jgi:pimeloyl-ACP methyl ester carboxylesterase
MEQHLLVPGWAMSGRVFSHFDDYKTATVVDQPVWADWDEIASIINDSPHPWRVSGFSLGGLLAVNELLPRLKTDVAFRGYGLRPIYSVQDIEAVRSFLHHSPIAYIKSFYKACFSADQSSEPFLDNMMLANDEFRLEELDEGLNYLELHSLSPDHWPSNSALIHGSHDRIAPIDEIHEWAKDHSKQLLRLPEAGHFCLDMSLVAHLDS